jgi:hypothetical protein
MLRTAATVLILVSLVGTIQSRPAAYLGHGTSSGYAGSYRFGGTGMYSGRSSTFSPASRFYDLSGHYVGRPDPSKAINRYYNGGSYTGKSVTSGSTTKFFDPNGKYLGKQSK